MVTDGAQSSSEQIVVAYLGTDGHRSVRVLYDAAAAIAQAAGIPQIYHFDAYGNLLNFADGTTPITSYLYSGEAFDFTIGQHYLRARWYDPTTGRFNRLDPFFGNQSDPQSFHKYAYVHGDPVNGVDPTGMFLGLAFGVSLQMMLPGPGDFIIGGLQALVQAYVVNLAWDIEWAQDLSLPDSWGSRLDNDWVYSALSQGIYDAFRIEIPFTGIGFNPLDEFNGFAAARGPNRIKNIGGGRTAEYSSTLRRSDKLGNEYEVHVYYNKRISQHRILHLPPGHPPIKKTANIRPTGKSSSDIEAANARFGKKRDYDWKKEHREPMTWHHDVKKGEWYSSHENFITI